MLPACFITLGRKPGLYRQCRQCECPFDMDGDRSQLIDSKWNTWLLEQAVELIFSLLTTDWVRRFVRTLTCVCGRMRCRPPISSRRRWSSDCGRRNAGLHATGKWEHPNSFSLPVRAR